jgi:hypothetical protein
VWGGGGTRAEGTRKTVRTGRVRGGRATQSRRTAARKQAAAGRTQPREPPRAGLQATHMLTSVLSSIKDREKGTVNTASKLDRAVRTMAVATLPSAMPTQMTAEEDVVGAAAIIVNPVPNSTNLNVTGHTGTQVTEVRIHNGTEKEGHAGHCTQPWVQRPRCTHTVSQPMG